MQVFSARRCFTPKNTWIGLLLLCGSCTSPDGRYEALTRHFIEDRPKTDLFEIPNGKTPVQWPLPPSQEGLSALNTFLNNCKSKSYEINPEKLQPENRIGLLRFRQAIDSLNARRGGGRIDPGAYALGAQIAKLMESRDTVLTLAIERLPAYYDQVYARWSAPEPAGIRAAVASSQKALDLLDELEPSGARRLRNALPAARSAVRDYIGLCLSGQLAE